MQIKELEDYPWFPPLLRRFQTEIIGEIAVQVQAYKALRQPVGAMIRRHSLTRMVDLCSGSGKPALALHKAVGMAEIPLFCTDLYPASLQPNPGYIVVHTPVDVLNLTCEKGVMYTMLNAFHHFDDKQKKAIIQQMIKQRACFVFAEILKPGVLSLLQVCVASVVGTLLFTPFIRPFSWLRLGLTYLLPINILTVLIDGILSVFRATNKTKLKKIFASEIENGQLDVVERFSFPVFITYIQSIY